MGLALLALLTLPVAHGLARAEDGLTAAQVAARVQSFYDQTQTVGADFHQTYVHKLYDRVDRSHGHVRFKKPGKMRWDYAEPNGKVIVSNGERLIVYEPGDDGGSGQMYTQPIEEAELPQALSFLTGTGRLEEDFHFRLLDAKRQGFPSGHVLELRPKQANPHYERILFYVERHEKLAGLVRRVLIVDHSGNRNRFDFKNLRFNREIPEREFQWTPPKGTRRIQP